MHNPIQILKTKHQLPIDVVTENGHETWLLKVVQAACDLEMTDSQYLESIVELIGSAPASFDWNKQHAPKYVFRYLVQNLVKNYKSGNLDTIDVVYASSITQALKYIENNPWVFATGESSNVPPKLDSNGNVQPKKGDKKALAKEVWIKNKDKVQGRGPWVELLMKEVGLTKGGASTYYHNLKTGVY